MRLTTVLICFCGSSNTIFPMPLNYLFVLRNIFKQASQWSHMHHTLSEQGLSFIKCSQTLNNGFGSENIFSRDSDLRNSSVSPSVCLSVCLSVIKLSK